MRTARLLTACPCGRAGDAAKPLLFSDCCGRFLDHLDSVQAPDAESLMRSRYSAFARGDGAYLLATWAPETRPASVSAEPGTKWLGLEVRNHRQIDDAHSEVEFVARYRTASGAVRLHERSRFLRFGERWYYQDGDQC